MASITTTKSPSMVISALKVRSNFGRILDRLESEGESLVIEKRGRPRAVLLSIREYVKLAAPEPDVLRIIGQESQRNRTSSLSRRQIDRVIHDARIGKNGRR